MPNSALKKQDAAESAPNSKGSGIAERLTTNRFKAEVLMAKYLTVHKAIEELTGSRPNPSTVWRWTAKGSKGVKLQTWMIGGRRMTTSEAVNDFIEARSKQPVLTPPVCKIINELNQMFGRSETKSSI